MPEPLKTDSIEVVPAAISGPPVTGVHEAGERITDSNRVPWICISSGTPGTWIREGTLRIKQVPVPDSAALVGDELVVLASAAGGPVTVTLPAVPNQYMTIKKVDGTGNIVGIDPGAGTIDGIPGVLNMSVPMTSWTLASPDGTNWYIL